MAHTNKHRTMRNAVGLFTLVTLAIGTLLLTPPRSFAQAKSSKKSVDSVNSVIKEVTKIRDQVHGALESLNALTSGAETKLPKRFKDYSKHVATMAKAQKTTIGRVEDMKARHEAYLKEWEKEMESVTNPEIKAHMEQRQEEVRKTLESAKPAGEQAREAFAPFLLNLQEIQRMLSLDLSPSGVAAAAPIAQKATSEGNKVLAALDTRISALTTIKAQVSPKGK